MTATVTDWSWGSGSNASPFQTSCHLESCTGLLKHPYSLDPPACSANASGDAPRELSVLVYKSDKSDVVNIIWNLDPGQDYNIICSKIILLKIPNAANRSKGWLSWLQNTGSTVQQHRLTSQRLARTACGCLS